MDRRAFLAGGAAFLAPLCAEAQPALSAVGVLNATRLARHNDEYRSAEGQYDRLPALAADLVRRQVP